MLTIFTTCMPFTGERKQIQYNAILSWMNLEPTPEILIMGRKEGGVQEFAETFDIKIIDVDYNEYGIPFVNSIFQNAQKHATNKVLCYTNSDIIHFQCLIDAVNVLKNTLDEYLCTGQRWDVNIEKKILTEYDFEKLKKQGIIHPSHGCDYFIYPQKMDWSHMPSFTMGRMKWDTWINADIYNRGIPFVDGTKMINIIHQNHERPYLTDPLGKQLMEQNTNLAGEKDIGCDIATHILEDNKIKGYWQRYLLPYIRL